MKCFRPLDVARANGWLSGSEREYLKGTTSRRVLRRQTARAIKDDEVRLIRQLYVEGMTQKAIAVRVKRSASLVCLIINKRRYAEVV